MSLEDELRADPDNAELALVYADALTARGDPRGELIVIQHHLESARGSAYVELRDAEAAHLAKHADALVGPLADATLTWCRGFVRRIEAPAASHGEVAAMLLHPSADRVRELALDGVSTEIAAWAMTPTTILALARIELLLDDWLDAAVVIDTLAAVPHPHLQEFVFGSTRVHERAKAGELYAAWDVQPLVDEDSVAAFCAATPNLRALELRGEYIFEGLVHPALRELTCIGAAINNLPFAFLPARVELPMLERFEQQLIVDEYRPAMIGAITLDARTTPKLVDLSIWGPYMRIESQGSVLQHLANSSIVSQLRRLRIADLCEEVDNEPLEQLASQLRRLERFHVDAIDEDGDAFDARVREMLPNLIIGSVG